MPFDGGGAGGHQAAHGEPRPGWRHGQGLLAQPRRPLRHAPVPRLAGEGVPDRRLASARELSPHVPEDHGCLRRLGRRGDHPRLPPARPQDLPLLEERPRGHHPRQGALLRHQRRAPGRQRRGRALRVLRRPPDQDRGQPAPPVQSGPVQPVGPGLGAGPLRPRPPEGPGFHEGHPRRQRSDPALLGRLLRLVEAQRREGRRRGWLGSGGHRRQAPLDVPRRRKSPPAQGVPADDVACLRPEREPRSHARHQRRLRLALPGRPAV